MMCDQDDRRGEGVVRPFAEGSYEFFASTEIETCARFVQEDHVGFVHQQASEQNSLLLSR